MSARLIQIEGQHRVAVTDLARAAETWIGRDSDCDFVIDDPGVSRRHACVRSIADGADCLQIRRLQIKDCKDLVRFVGVPCLIGFFLGERCRSVASHNVIESCHSAVCRRVSGTRTAPTPIATTSITTDRPGFRRRVLTGDHLQLCFWRIAGGSTGSSGMHTSAAGSVTLSTTSELQS